MAKAKKAEETPKYKVGDIYEADGKKYEVVEIQPDGSVIVTRLD